MKPISKYLSVLLLASAIAPSAGAFTVGNKMEGPLVLVKTALSVAHRHVNLSGHEEITRQAIIQAKKVAKKNKIIVPSDLSDMAFQNLEPAKFGLIGAEATNPLIQGNYATDFPFTRKDYPVHIPAFWELKGINGDMDWQNHPKTQKFHFLRDHLARPDARGSILVGQRQSCYNTRDAIIKVTKQASLLYRQGLKAKSRLSEAERKATLKKVLFLLGHGTHMLQDSFSEAHGLRKGRTANHDLREICYFGFDSDLLHNPRTHSTRLNSCHHSVDEIIRDGLWVKDFDGIDRVKKEWPTEPVIEDTYEGVYTCLKNVTYRLTDNETCLKHTPRLARTATAKYLLVMIDYMKFSDEEISQKDHLKNFLIKNFFEGSLRLKGLDETMPKGVMRCGNLPE